MLYISAACTFIQVPPIRPLLCQQTQQVQRACLLCPQSLLLLLPMSELEEARLLLLEPLLPPVLMHCARGCWGVSVVAELSGLPTAVPAEFAPEQCTRQSCGTSDQHFQQPS